MIMESIILKNCEVTLQDNGGGNGKIIISGVYSSSYHWGSMGMSLKAFLCSIDVGYFIKNMCKELYSFSSKRSVTSFRQEIKRNIPFYIEMEAQKEMRRILRNLSDYSCEGQFLQEIQDLPDTLESYLEDPHSNSFLYDLKDILYSPYDYVETELSEEAVYFSSVFEELKLRLL